MNETKRNIAVGLTTLAGVLGLGALMMVFGYVPGLLDRGYDVRIVLPHAAGLTEGSRLSIKGIDVGEVQSLALRPEGVIATAHVKNEAELPVGTRAMVTLGSLIGGGAGVELVLDDVEPGAAMLPRDGTAQIPGTAETLAGQITSQLAAAIEGPAEDFNRLTNSFETLSGEWAQVGTEVRGLLEQRDVVAVDNGEAAGNLSTALARMDRRLAELEQPIADIKTVAAEVKALVGDEQLRSDIKATAANARQMSDTVAGSIDEVKTSVTGGVAALKSRYIAVADDMSGTLASLRETSNRLREGDGTAAKFINDPALYNNLNDAAQRMNTAIDDLKLLIRTWKDEGVPVELGKKKK